VLRAAADAEVDPWLAARDLLDKRLHANAKAA
jgi:hypothetical protein